MKLEDKPFLLECPIFRGEAVVIMSLLPGRNKKSGSKSVRFTGGCRNQWQLVQLVQDIFGSSRRELE